MGLLGYRSESCVFHCSEAMCWCECRSTRKRAAGAYEVLNEGLELLLRLEDVLALADQLDFLVGGRCAGGLVARGGGGRRLGEQEADAEPLAEVARAEAAAADEKPVVFGIGVQLGRERVLLLQSTTNDTTDAEHILYMHSYLYALYLLFGELEQLLLGALDVFRGAADHHIIRLDVVRREMDAHVVALGADGADEAPVAPDELLVHRLRNCHLHLLYVRLFRQKLTDVSLQFTVIIVLKNGTCLRAMLRASFNLKVRILFAL